MMFKPRKIQESELKHWKHEQDCVCPHIFVSLTKPFIDIPDQNSPSEHSSKKMTNPTIEKLTLSKSLILTHILVMLDEVIDALTDIENAQTILNNLKNAFSTFKKIKSALTKKLVIGITSTFHLLNIL